MGPNLLLKNSVTDGQIQCHLQHRETYGLGSFAVASWPYYTRHKFMKCGINTMMPRAMITLLYGHPSDKAGYIWQRYVNMQTDSHMVLTSCICSKASKTQNENSWASNYKLFKLTKECQEAQAGSVMKANECLYFTSVIFFYMPVRAQHEIICRQVLWSGWP